MIEQYIKLTDGQRVRIETNWNTMIKFLDDCNMSFEDFVENSQTNQLSAKHLRTMAYCCAVEGERMAGRTMEMSEEDFGALLSPAVMSDFAIKFTQQFGGAQDEKKKDPERQKKVRTRPMRRER